MKWTLVAICEHVRCQGEATRLVGIELDAIERHAIVADMIQRGCVKSEMYVCPGCRCYIRVSNAIYEWREEAESPSQG